MSQLLRRWAVCLGALCHAVGVSAAVIVVPVDQPTIQQAVDAATDGDEIVLMPGAYAENVEIPGLSLTIRSTDPERTKEGGHAVFAHHTKTYGHPSEFGYKDFIPMFKAEKFKHAAPATTGPAKHPLPTSSTPTGVRPSLSH